MKTQNILLDRYFKNQDYLFNDRLEVIKTICKVVFAVLITSGVIGLLFGILMYYHPKSMAYYDNASGGIDVVFSYFSKDTALITGLSVFSGFLAVGLIATLAPHRISLKQALYNKDKSLLGEDGLKRSSEIVTMTPFILMVISAIGALAVTATCFALMDQVNANPEIHIDQDRVFAFAQERIDLHNEFIANFKPWWFDDWFKNHTYQYGGDWRDDFLNNWFAPGTEEIELERFREYRYLSITNDVRAYLPGFRPGMKDSSFGPEIFSNSSFTPSWDYWQWEGKTPYFVPYETAEGLHSSEERGLVGIAMFGMSLAAVIGGGGVGSLSFLLWIRRRNRIDVESKQGQKIIASLAKWRRNKIAIDSLLYELGSNSIMTLYDNKFIHSSELENLRREAEKIERAEIITTYLPRDLTNMVVLY